MAMESLENLDKGDGRTWKSLLSPRDKGSKVTPNAAMNGSGSPAVAPPPSPGKYRPGCTDPSCSSPVTSPVKNLFKINEEEGDGRPSKSNLTRSLTEPIMSKIYERGRSFRMSLKSKKNKDCNKKGGPEVSVPAGEDSAKENLERKMCEEQKQEEAREEMEESYTLPEIPHTPLSVMQIRNLIEMEVLEEAHLNLLAMRREFQQERERHAEDSPIELAKKEKDLNLLYGDLRKKICGIVSQSNSLPLRNKGLLVPVVRIIQEEERRAKEPGGLPDSWMAAWREAVVEGVRTKVDGVHLDQREQNPCWLAVHLGLLGKATVEDLEGVKRELRWSYPPSFNVFNTYVRSYHQVVALHLKKLEQHATELKDLYALLDWIVHKYQSERVMGSVSLQLDSQAESTNLQLDPNFLPQLKEKYCSKMKEDMRSSLDRVIELEHQEVWRDGKDPWTEDGFLSSQFPMDIWTNVKSNIVHSGEIDAPLEVKVSSLCLEELRHFIHRFETQFRHHCSSAPLLLRSRYHIAYINSFTLLQQHMEGYRNSCPKEMEGLGKNVKWLTVQLLQNLENEFKDEVKPFLRRMMTRNWLTTDEDFKHLRQRTEQLQDNCALLRPPHSQDLSSRLHYHVVKEYVGQLMKNNYRCRSHERERAAQKIRQQWSELRVLFEEMESSHNWLHPLGDQLSNIIGQKNQNQIKNQLQPLVENFPDFRKKHLVAILDFGGLLRGREHQLILQKLTALQKDVTRDKVAEGRVLFSDMQVTVNSDCLYNLPFFCLSILRPNS